jgi:hypothetical protein
VLDALANAALGVPVATASGGDSTTSESATASSTTTTPISLAAALGALPPADALCAPLSELANDLDTPGAAATTAAEAAALAEAATPLAAWMRAAAAAADATGLGRRAACVASVTALRTLASGAETDGSAATVAPPRLDFRIEAAGSAGASLPPFSLVPTSAASGGAAWESVAALQGALAPSAALAGVVAASQSAPASALSPTLTTTLALPNGALAGRVVLAAML